MAKYYVDILKGEDGKSGLSKTEAWRTISRVNASKFAPGDSVLFKRGQKWKEQLTVSSSGVKGGNIIYGAFGTGALPVIDGEYLVNNCIRAEGKNFIVYQDLELTGSRIEGLFHSAYGSKASDIIVQRLKVHNTGYPGFEKDNIYPNGLSFAASNVIVRNCELYACGWNGFTAGPPSNGPAFNILLEGNRVHNNYHNGVDFKTSSPAGHKLSNITVRRNRILNNSGSSSNGLIVMQNNAPITDFFAYENLIAGNEQQGISIQANGIANYMINGQFYDNVIMANGGMGAQLMNNGGCFKNNVLANNNTKRTSTKEVKIYYTGSFPKVDGNIYQSAHNAIIGINNDSAITLATFREMGYELTAPN